MLYGGWILIRESGRVLMEGAPKGVSPEEVGAAMAAWPGVIEVHDLHVWEVTSGFPALAAHVLVGEAEDCQQRRRDIAAMLRERFGIEHSTLQVEQWSGKSELLRIEEKP
jgi:cobalt-zinc-cadmium efflux system protein